MVGPPLRILDDCPVRGDVRYWHLADIGLCAAHFCFTPESGHSPGEVKRSARQSPRDNP